jgi:hypothetical protein
MHIVLVRTSQKTVTPSTLPPSPLPKPKHIPDLERRLDRDSQNKGHFGKPRNIFLFLAKEKKLKRCHVFVVANNLVFCVIFVSVVWFQGSK